MLRKILLTLGVLSIAGTAMAEDITNPFYLSYEGQFGSITSLSTERLVIKNNNAYIKSHKTLLKEDIQYGLTDSLSLIAGFGNIWDRWKGTPVNYLGGPTNKAIHDNENILWNAGLAWNILEGPTRLQVSAQYGQDRWKNYDGEYKYALGEIKWGYQFQRVLPYLTGSVEIPIGQKSGTKGIAGDKFVYNAKAGIYQGKCETWALDTGLRLRYDENTEARMIAAEAEASYYLTNSATLGVYGTYSLDGKSKYDLDVYDKSIGMRLRMFF